MGMDNKKQTPQDKDRHLDIPSEANRDKHINFREVEEGGYTGDTDIDDATRERQRQWQQGIEEGKRNKKA